MESEELDKYRAMASQESSPDFIIEMDSETESHLPEFGISVQGDAVVCKKAHGYEWSDNFSKDPEQFGRKEIWVHGMLVAGEKHKPIGLTQYPNAKGIKLQYVPTGSERKNMLAEYSQSHYLDYYIYEQDSQNDKHYNIEWDGFKRSV